MKNIHKLYQKIIIIKVILFNILFHSIQKYACHLLSAYKKNISSEHHESKEEVELKSNLNYLI